jgi:hypothetical protein
MEDRLSGLEDKAEVTEKADDKDKGKIMKKYEWSMQELWDCIKRLNL